MSPSSSDERGPTGCVLTRPGRPAIARRLVRIVIDAALALLALRAYLIAYRGGSAGGFRLLDLKTTLIILLALLIVHMLVKARGRWREVLRARPAGVMFALIFIAYLSAPTSSPTGDTTAMRYLPFSILREGNFDLDEFPGLFERGLPGFLEFVNGHYVSAYPVAAALLALPAYLPTALGGTLPPPAFLSELEHVAAAGITALSVAMLHSAVSRIASPGLALAITAIYAFGSSSYSTSSRALWQHGPSQLALVGLLYCLVRARERSWWAALAGLPLAFAVIARPTDLLLVLPLVVYITITHVDRLPGFALTALPPIVFQLGYNSLYFGDPFRTQLPMTESWVWSTPLATGLTGILLSPGRGLFVYSPIFLLSLIGLASAWRRRGDPLLRCLGIGVLLDVLFYGKFFIWWGGFCFGPRYFADLAPTLAFGLAPLEPALMRRRLLRAAFVILTAWSVAAHAIGVYAGGTDWNASVYVDRHPERLWWWSDNQLVNPPSNRLGRLLVRVGGLPTSRSDPGQVAAGYTVDAPPMIGINPLHPVDLSITARNVGQAVWLSGTAEGQGTVGLRWAWRAERGGADPAENSGFRRLRYNVAPGRSHTFFLVTPAPARPGRYFLDLGLVVDGGATSPAGAIEGVSIALEVRGD